MRSLNQAEYKDVSGGLVFQVVDNFIDGDTSNGSLSSGAIVSYGGGKSGPVGTGMVVGAVTGATICVGLTIPSAGISVPLVPYCAAIGGFIGNNVESSATGGSGGGNISDTPAA